MEIGMVERSLDRVPGRRDRCLDNGLYELPAVRVGKAGEMPHKASVLQASFGAEPGYFWTAAEQPGACRAILDRSDGAVEGGGPGTEDADIRAPQSSEVDFV